MLPTAGADMMALVSAPSPPAPRPVPRRLRLGLALLCGLPLFSAQAQPVLHEPVPSPSLRCFQGVCKRDGERSDALPDAVLGPDGMVGAPRSSATPLAHEQVLSSASQATPATPAQATPPAAGQDPPALRRLRVAPDEYTGVEPAGERAYHEVFNPAVFPYKRMTVLDAVDEEGRLYVQPESPRQLPVDGNRLSPGRDPFYASLVVDIEPRQWVPLPTPAAGLRLLSYETQPASTLRFRIDSAENVSVQGFRAGRHRLVYLVDAPQRYFAGPLIPPQAPRPRLADLPDVPPVPGALRREAARVLAHIGLRPTPASDYFEILNTLVGYFRDFSIAPLGEADDGRSLYLRIALSQRGVCRHRSYAFAITALAAGIPTRYVENELHVFIEVFIPAAGGQPGYWRRINLGGAPLQQRVLGGESRTAYQEKGGDPFERPERFRQGRAPSVTGLPRRSERSERGPAGAKTDALPALDGPEDRAKARAASGPTPGRDGSGPPGTSGDPSPGRGDGKEGSGPGRAQGTAAGTGPGGRSSSPGVVDFAGEGGEESGSDEPALPPDDLAMADDRRPESRLAPTQVSVSVGAARRMYRGAAVPVRGQVQVQGRGASAAGLDVYLYLATSPAAVLLGRTVTGPDGSFALELTIPGTAPLGSFQLVARVRGDEQRRGSSSGHYTAPAAAK